MNYNDLIGLRMESCSISKAAYSFELDGQIDGENYNFDISTNCYLSFSDERKDIGDSFTKGMWAIFETYLENVIVNEEDELVIFEFEKGNKIYVWWDSPLNDNLLVVRRKDAKEWFTIL